MVRFETPLFRLAIAAAITALLSGAWIDVLSRNMPVSGGANEHRLFFPIVLNDRARIVGPAQGRPGEPLSFRLAQGDVQLPVERWEQVFNLDRYVGNDYVTSFSLQMETAPDGTLRATAPAPGRYKIAATKGGQRWEAYVLIRPARILPEIRGSAFVGRGPIPRPSARASLSNRRVPPSSTSQTPAPRH